MSVGPPPAKVFPDPVFCPRQSSSCVPNVTSGLGEAVSMNSLIEPEFSKSALLWIRPWRSRLLPLVFACLSLLPLQFVSA